MPFPNFKNLFGDKPAAGQDSAQAKSDPPAASAAKSGPASPPDRRRHPIR